MCVLIEHVPQVNKNLNDMGVKFVPQGSEGAKDFSEVQELQNGGSSPPLFSGSIREVFSRLFHGL